MIAALTRAVFSPMLSALMLEFYEVYWRGIIICDAKKGTFEYINPYVQGRLGYKPSEIKGKPFIEFVHPDDVESTSKADARVKEDGTIPNFVNRYRSKNGTYKTVKWNAAIIGRFYLCEVEIYDTD